MRPDRFERLTRWGTGALMLLLIHGVGRLDRPGPAATTSSSRNPIDSSNFNQTRCPRRGRLVLSFSDLTQDPRRPRGRSARMPCSGPGCSSRSRCPCPTTIPGPMAPSNGEPCGVPVILPGRIAPSTARCTRHPPPRRTRGLRLPSSPRLIRHLSPVGYPVRKARGG